ncbi:MAG: HAD hydrolase-like protein [Ardenticatenaceae bacterium]|nr:HAD hydrolase-like protein [Ardenticatenaceae bacterium]
MSLKAIIFDVDGTIVDSEKDGHMAACNEAFATMGFDICWNWAQFSQMLTMPGNRQRMRLALSERYPEMGEAELDETAVRLFALKKKLFIEKYIYQVPVREGVVALMEEALAHNLKLAIVTMSHEAQVKALLAHHLPDYAARFQPILGKPTGSKTAPDAPLHRLCLAHLNLSPTEAVMIEDSAIGCQAAQRAGIPCAVFYNEYTHGEDFRGAALVARSLAYFDLQRLADLCLPGNHQS